VNLEYLVRPALYGGTSGVAVAAVGFGIADWQSVSPFLTAGFFMLVGTITFGLLLGASSLNENSETPDPLVEGDHLLSPPTSSGAERRLTVACFGAALALSGFAAGMLIS